ncbi:hypothetical protein LK07_30710 [Streptomyces pluripotens]|uniref:NAD-dependent epimerase/dehydratase domain-containing protein n=1 Tax=Streptomyces pluripotens TaxID=1355015 RepID=A0A221P5Z3_9ACTN|nr:hypothetical protein LK06_029520 [Streptomyces pluripotens]ASN27679.1 hypothetical protein LK07_30710 [Streptomyces pluripotens]
MRLPLAPPARPQRDLSVDLLFTEDLAGPLYDADGMYGHAKLMGELTLRALHQEHGFKAASCRYFTMHGPRGIENHAVIAMMARALIRQNPFEIWGDGTRCETGHVPTTSCRAPSWPATPDAVRHWRPCAPPATRRCSPRTRSGNRRSSGLPNVTPAPRGSTTSARCCGTPTWTVYSAADLIRSARPTRSGFISRSAGGAVSAVETASAAVGAADGESWALLLATGHAPGSTSVPPGARVLLHRFGGLRAASDWLDVVVCHGGHSTALAGLLAGRPVLVIPPGGRLPHGRRHRCLGWRGVTWVS